MKLRWLCAVALLAGAVPAVAAEPVRHIGIHVQPFYEAALTPDGRPQVSVGKQYSALLGSSRRVDIIAARDLITASTSPRNDTS
ncbi:MAG TPA: hypothetical protein VIY07_16910 [Pseudolabrys sp.]